MITPVLPCWLWAWVSLSKDLLYEYWGLYFLGYLSAVDVIGCDVEGYIALTGDMDALGLSFGYRWFVVVAFGSEDGKDIIYLFGFHLCWRGVRLIIAIRCRGPRQIS